MPAPTLYPLIGGPYRPPRTRPGRTLFCEIRGTVTVVGFRDGPIVWPYAQSSGRPLILCGDLVRAVKVEAGVAVAQHFGCSVGTVKKWRRALGVPEYNEGTRELFRTIETNRTDDRLTRARARSKTPAVLRKLSKKLKGRVQSAATINAVRKAAKRPRSEQWKRKMAAYWRNRGRGPSGAKIWTPQEEAMLGVVSDAEVARRTRRPITAVVDRRRRSS